MRSLFLRWVFLPHARVHGVNLIHTNWPLTQMDDLIFGLKYSIPNQVYSCAAFALILMETPTHPRPVSPWGSSPTREPKPAALLNTCSTRGNLSNSGFYWNTRIQNSSNSCILFLKTKAQLRLSWSLCKMNQQDILTPNENLIYVSSEYLLVIYFGLSLFLTGLAPRKGSSSGKGTTCTRHFCPHSPPWQLWPGLLPCRGL